MPPTSRPVLLAASALALALAGCGGGDDSSSGSGSGSGSGVTQQQFAQQANAICTELETEGRRFTEQITSAEDAGAITTAIDAVSTAGRQAAQRLQALEQPAGEAGATAKRFVDTSVRAVQQGLPELDALRTAVEQEDRQAVETAAQALGEDSPEDAESDRLAQQIGATACVDDDAS